MEQMWAAKLGLGTFDAALFSELVTLMEQTPVDYTIFFRELSTLPDDIGPLKKSFYNYDKPAVTSKLCKTTKKTDPKGLDQRWSQWLTQWKSLINSTSVTSPCSHEELSKQMKLVNPKYTLREWFVVPAYKQAATGDYSLVQELQEVMSQPFAEQSKAVEEKYYRLTPAEFF